MHFVIVGAGVFGLLTAYSLTKQNHQVTIIDTYRPPSPLSAANDYNKIIRAEYNDEIYVKLFLEAIDAWRNEFSLVYNECGRISVVPKHAGQLQFEKSSIAMVRRFSKNNYEHLIGGKQLSQRFLWLENNSFGEEVEFTYSPESGLGRSSESLQLMLEKVLATGYAKLFNDEILLVTDDGARAKSGKVYTGEKYLVCCGANTGSIIDLNHQTSSTVMFVAHIQLSEQEYQKYYNMPIVFSSELGYFFPPDPLTKKLKIAAVAEQCVNYGTSRKSFPITQTTISSIHSCLEKSIPELAKHPVIDPKLCWFSDLAGSDFLIDQVPTSERVFVATGDLGHAYKFLPTIGKYIYQRMVGTLDQGLRKKWRWKDAKKDHTVNWRVERGVIDLTDESEATERKYSRHKL